MINDWVYSYSEASANTPCTNFVTDIRAWDCERLVLLFTWYNGYWSCHSMECRVELGHADMEQKQKIHQETSTSPVQKCPVIAEQSKWWKSKTISECRLSEKNTIPMLRRLVYERVEVTYDTLPDCRGRRRWDPSQCRRSCLVNML
jgi:hypothetical protein